MSKEREVIKLSNANWRNLVQENYIDLDGVEVNFEEIDTIYDGSRRHTEEHHNIVQRVPDGKFFRVDYETSIKDEMGWYECNYGETSISEVFPETVTTTVYK